MVIRAASARRAVPAPERPRCIRMRGRESIRRAGEPSAGAGPASSENSRVSATEPEAVGNRVSSPHGAGGDRVSPRWHPGHPTDPAEALRPARSPRPRCP
jgi:hypothetical protein